MECAWNKDSISFEFKLPEDAKIRESLLQMGQSIAVMRANHRQFESEIIAEATAAVLKRYEEGIRA